MQQFTMFDTPEVEIPEWQKRLTAFKQQPAILPADPLPKGPTALLRIGATAKKLETLADGIQKHIDAKMADRQTNTPKRLGQAMSARAEGERLARTQSVLRALAALHRGEGCPADLAGFKSKKAVHDLMGAEMAKVENGFHAYYADTGQPRENASPEALKLWALLSGKSEEEQRADELRQMVEGLQFSKIPGYFPTPSKVVETMVHYAQIEAGHKVLEPSAGSGAILDELDQWGPEDIAVTCYEVNCTLANILEAKGYPVHGSDFLRALESDRRYDRVLMNPPFEKQADIDHVLMALEVLEPGGRVVAIMSASPFFRDNGKSRLFRRILEDHTSEVIDLPEGSFKDSGTGVNTKLVIIDKE